MKKTLPILLAFLYAGSIQSQITTPVVKANFGIDADTRANYFNGLATAAADDWYNRSAGAGQYVIDTTGASAILSGYTTSPSTRMNTFSKVMKQDPYTTVSNRILLDAVFHRDFHGTDSTVFSSGSNKNGSSPASWACPVAQGIPDKNEILDVFCH